MDDFISIITPTYNCCDLLEETIQCVLNQSYFNWELIIYDDASTDNTKQIIDKYLKIDNRIKYFWNEVNCGVAVTRNHALQQAKGKWIAFLDSDDVWLPNKLERQIRFMEENHYHFSYHDYMEIDEQSNELGILVGGPNKISKLGMYSRCWCGCLSIMYDRFYIGNVKFKDIMCEDYAMWLQLVQKSDCYRLNECLAKYRRRENSRNPHTYIGKIKGLYQVFHIAEEKNILVSIWWIGVNMICQVIKKIFYTKRYETGV